MFANEAHVRIGGQRLGGTMEGGLGHMTALAPSATSLTYSVVFSDLLGGLRTDTLTSRALQYLKLFHNLVQTIILQVRKLRPTKVK